MSSLEALLPDDLEKHVQLNRARLNSYGVLRERSKHTVSVEATQHETQNRKVRHTQEETTQWTSVRLVEARANKARASTARAKAKDSKDSKDSKDETGARTSTRTRIRLNAGTVVCTDTTRKTVGVRRTPTLVVRKESTNPRMQRMLTILTRLSKVRRPSRLNRASHTSGKVDTSLWFCELHGVVSL